MPSLRWLMLVAFVGSLPLGCFSEPKSDLPPGCSLGQHLCPCDDGACEPGLTCSVSADVCVAIDCEVGALECPCGSGGACNPSLVCGEYGYCVPEDGAATSGDPTVASSVSDSMSSTTSETMSTTEATTASTTVSTTDDPDTTASTSDGTDSTSDPSTTSGTMTTTDAETTTDDDVTTNDPTAVLDIGGSDGCRSEVECGECLDCARMNECSAIWAECTNVMQGIDAFCVNGYMAYYTCASMQNEAQCNSCDGASPLADEMFACLAEVCDAQCTCL